MMRKIGVVFVALATLLPLYRFVVVPWHCNQVAKILEGALQPALSGDLAAQWFLGEYLPTAETCRQRVPCDANLNVAIASTHVLAGRTEEALRVYEDALHFDRRPEMYFNRAGIRLGAGDTAGALDDFTWAARFNPSLVDLIRTEAIRTRVRDELDRIRTAGAR